MPQNPVRRIARIALTVTDLVASARFFHRALGFEETAHEHSAGRAFAEAIRVPGATAETIVMRLGAQELELSAYAPAGRAYPTERSAVDPWFQHFAIVVSDMRAAYAMLGAEPGWTAISSDGPERLPQETGGIVAFKFRDPEGHPLELSWFPPAVAGAWRDVCSPTPFLGIDHSALGVADPVASTRFYVDHLGFTHVASQVNTGAAQDKLDGLAGARVEISTLSTADPGPHIELLGYGRAPTPVARHAVNDLVSTRLILEAAPGSSLGMTSDPDGHLLEIRAGLGISAREYLG